MNIRNEILRVNSCYEAFITQKQSKREEFYSAFKEGPIWNNSLISEHMEETQHIPTEPFQTEKKIFMIIRDLLIFPELYLDDIDQNKLSDLFHLIDNHDCF
ncbi:MAG: hypothetical protein JO131_03095, partial [Gammaproteobacteria bacterium]|nr:hypothetical protein [Gammaproteobacteria bacterium]